MPTRGIERWLIQRLSARLGTTPTAPESADGVCANVEFPFPGRLVGAALALASGIDPERDPWLPERMAWPLLEVVEDVARGAVAGAASQPPAGRPGAPVRTAAPTRPPVRRVLGAATRAAARLGPRRGSANGSVRRLAGRALAPAARADRRAERRRASRSGVGAVARRAGARLAAGSDHGVRTDPDSGWPPAGAAGAGRQPRRSPDAAAPLAGAVGQDERADGLGRAHPLAPAARR